MANTRHDTEQDLDYVPRGDYGVDDPYSREERDRTRPTQPPRPSAPQARADAVARERADEMDHLFPEPDIDPAVAARQARMAGMVHEASDRGVTLLPEDLVEPPEDPDGQIHLF